MAYSSDSALFRTQAMPSAAKDLGLEGSVMPDELAERKRKLMAASTASSPFPYGGAASVLFGKQS